jgi:hypothetical protein
MATRYNRNTNTSFDDGIPPAGNARYQKGQVTTVPGPNGPVYPNGNGNPPGAFPSRFATPVAPARRGLVDATRPGAVAPTPVQPFGNPSDANAALLQAGAPGFGNGNVPAGLTGSFSATVPARNAAGYITDAGAQAAANRAAEARAPSRNPNAQPTGLIASAPVPIDQQPEAVRGLRGTTILPGGGSVTIGGPTPKGIVGGAPDVAAGTGPGIYVNGVLQNKQADGTFAAGGPGGNAPPAFKDGFTVAPGVQTALIQKYPSLAVAGSPQNKAFLSTLAASGSDGSDAADIADKLFGGKNEATLRPDIGATNFKPVPTSSQPQALTSDAKAFTGAPLALNTGAATPLPTEGDPFATRPLPDLASIAPVAPSPGMTAPLSPGAQAAQNAKTAVGNAASAGYGAVGNALGYAADFASQFGLHGIAPEPLTPSAPTATPPVASPPQTPGLVMPTPGSPVAAAAANAQPSAAPAQPATSAPVAPVTNPVAATTPAAPPIPLAPDGSAHPLMPFTAPKLDNALLTSGGTGATTATPNPDDDELKRRQAAASTAGLVTSGAGQ